MSKKRKGTETSSFGVSKRENHDSSIFYNSRLYDLFAIEETKDGTENDLPEEIVNQIICQDSRKMGEIPDNSIHLMITSPPYNVGKEYDANLSLKEYLELLKEVFGEVYRVLVNGGRAIVNITNVGRKPYIPLHSYIIELMLEIGYYMRGELIWNKAASAGGSTAWGSWKSPSNPALRDVHEYILVFTKGNYSRKFTNKGEGESTISKEEFLEYTRSIWNFPTVSAKKAGHPAPFPKELPYRCIQLYSYEKDIVLDPFCGSGTTCVVAKENKRRFIGIDIEEKYVELAREKISKVE
ncbi:MAG: site-specific DNA-methyltransferase [Candidatus Heimdallarchaeota archaeon]|nr:site-specific DNA-methyltransferase [Candidatus Heimdallarchaeota archaeon]MCK5048837.1 site-specific DNA-methyltransferase [Candidatus Heimdallarchaeota archaeon]